MIWLISFSKFLDVLPAFTCASAIGNASSVCLGVKILSCLWFKTLCKIVVRPFPYFLFGKITLSKALRSFCLPLRSIIAFLRVSAFFSKTINVLRFLFRLYSSIFL